MSDVSNKLSPSTSTGITSSTGDTMTAPLTINRSGKVKQTRRRQRLSCIECTKRRQKCDRQFPCGLCTSRGIPHLCRWEPIVARPVPQRPPVIPTERATIEALSSRISALEQALLSKNNLDAQQKSDTPQAADRETSSLASNSQVVHEAADDSCSEPSRGFETIVKTAAQCENGPRALLDFDVQVAAVALAQLSLAPRTEYVGGGTVLCALHKLGDPDSWRFPHPSTSMMSPVSSSMTETCNMHPLSSPIRELVKGLPPRPHVEQLLRSFFNECNWQFGLSERWFRAAMQKMWAHLSLSCTASCGTEGGCAACKEEINPHWLSLLFSMLALAPASGQAAKESAKYFMSALTAKRMVDDILLVSPVYSASEGAVNGGVLSCIAAVFLAMYLADRGRVSESWKLTGTALRSAQALGMHRDPSWGKWERMPKVEVELRVLGWWLLMVSDRLFSFVLGRPAMVSKGSFDVLALPTDAHGDGSPNANGLFLRAYISLSSIVIEAAEKCLGIHAPPYATVLEMDRRFEEWESQLHHKLCWRKRYTEVGPGFNKQDSAASDDRAERTYAYQKHMLAGWYLTTLMNIHRPYLMHPPPILPPPRAASGPSTRLNPSRERCIKTAIELTRLMTAFHDEVRTWPGPCGLNAGAIAYFIFDGAVALAGALSQVPPHPQSEECLALMDKAMRVLKELADATGGATDGQGEMPRRAITILKALRKAGGWDMPNEEKGDLILLQDMLEQQRRRRQQQNPDPVGVPGSQGSIDFHSISPYDSQFIRTNPMYGIQQGPANMSSYIPFLSPRQHSPSNAVAYNQWNSPTTAPAMPQSGAQSPFYIPGMDTAPNFGLLPPSASNPGIRPVQSMVMPFDVLQGVQPDVQGTADIDLDWARLAGMESWYSSVSGMTSLLDGSVIP